MDRGVSRASKHSKQIAEAVEQRNLFSNMDIIEIDVKDPSNSLLNYFSSELMRLDSLAYMFEEQKYVRREAALFQKCFQRWQQVQTCSVHRLEVPDKKQTCETVINININTTENRNICSWKKGAVWSSTSRTYCGRGTQTRHLWFQGSGTSAIGSYGCMLF